MINHREIPDIFKDVPDTKDPQALYQQKLKEYEETIKQIEEESKSPLTAFERHVIAFLDNTKTFSTSTVKTILNSMHAKQAEIKASIIASFNATHSSHNILLPSFSGQFIKDEHGLLIYFYHLGTTRIWNIDGSINEERMNQFKRYFTDGQPKDSPQIATFSKLKQYLQQCYEKDPPETENGSGRNADAKYGLSTKKMRADFQATAAVQGWQEVYDRLTCGWTKDGDPYLTLEVAEEFLRDSPKAFLRATCGLLPVPKPEPEAAVKPVMPKNQGLFAKSGVCPYAHQSSNKNESPVMDMKL